MKQPIPHLIRETARELQMEIFDSPFHAAEGLELRKQIENTDSLTCVGYIRGPQKTAIYRRVASKKDVLSRKRLWFFYGWLIKPRPNDNQYRVLHEMSSAEFNEMLFIDAVKKELGAPQTSPM
jgi:hypothetical protein